MFYMIIYLLVYIYTHIIYIYIHMSYVGWKNAKQLRPISSFGNRQVSSGILHANPEQKNPSRSGWGEITPDGFMENPMDFRTGATPTITFRKA